MNQKLKKQPLLQRWSNFALTKTEAVVLFATMFGIGFACGKFL